MSARARIGILSFAHMHADAYAAVLALSPNIDFVGVSDSFPQGVSASEHSPLDEDARSARRDSDVECGRAKAAEFGTTFYPSAEALLDQGLDGVIVTSENAYHRAAVGLAASAGIRAILCEKPISTTHDDACTMIAACAASGTALATAFPCRYSPAYGELRNVVRSGGLGEILAIRGTNRGRCPGGWFTDKALSGGGAVIDHTVHVADLNRHLLGREAVSVYAQIGSGIRHGACEDSGLLSITYDGGVFATLDTSWSRPASYPIWGDVNLQVVGTAGVADFDLNAQTLSYYASAVAWPEWGSSLESLMIGDFVRLIRREEVHLLATGDDGLRALDLALAAYRSAEIGQPVSV